MHENWKNLHIELMHILVLNFLQINTCTCKNYFSPEIFYQKFSNKFLFLVLNIYCNCFDIIN